MLLTDAIKLAILPTPVLPQLNSSTSTGVLSWASLLIAAIQRQFTAINSQISPGPTGPAGPSGPRGQTGRFYPAIGNGIVSNNRGVYIGRTLIGEGYVVVANGDGIAGSPVISLAAPPGVLGMATVDLLSISDQSISIVPCSKYIIERILLINTTTSGSLSSLGSIFTEISMGGVSVVNGSGLAGITSTDVFTDLSLNPYTSNTVFGAPTLYYRCTHLASSGAPAEIVILGRVLA